MYFIKEAQAKNDGSSPQPDHSGFLTRTRTALIICSASDHPSLCCAHAKSCSLTRPPARKLLMAQLIGKLVPDDDYTHPLGPEPNFNESMYFNFFDPDPSSCPLFDAFFSLIS